MEVIPVIVKQFIAKNIHSLDILEILLLLYRESEREWGYLAVNQALRLERTSVQVRLERLRIAGLLSVRQVGTQTVYRYHPENGELSKAVDELAKWYSSHRVSIISLIFSNPAA